MRPDEEGTLTTYRWPMQWFTAERSIDIQHNIGADIIIAFDECTSPTADYKYQKEIWSALIAGLSGIMAGLAKLSNLKNKVYKWCSASVDDI